MTLPQIMQPTSQILELTYHLYFRILAYFERFFSKTLINIFEIFTKKIGQDLEINKMANELKRNQLVAFLTKTLDHQIKPLKKRDLFDDDAPKLYDHQRLPFLIWNHVFFYAPICLVAKFFS